MASPPILTPSGTTGFNIEKWQRTIEPATYQKMVGIPLVDEGDRPYNLLHIRKKARVTATVLGQSADGTGLTPSNIIDTPITVTPAGNYIMVQWSENEDAQLDVNLDDETRNDIEQALAESTDASFFTNVSSGTNIMSQAGADGPGLRQAIGRLMGLTNGVAMPGQGRPMIHAIFSNTQYPNLQNIPEVNNAQMRGGSETPYVTGIWTTGSGFKLHYSTVVTQDANGWHNPIFIPSAFVWAWNVRSRLKRQDYELTNKVIVYNNAGGAVKHNSRFIDFRTTASAL